MTRSLSLAALTIAALGFAADANAGGPFGSNPNVHASSSTSHHYDPFTDTHYIETNRNTTRASAYDWDRNYVDPGSYRYVDRYTVDQYGRKVREYGYVWTTNGKPHGKLTRDVVTVTPRRYPTYDPTYDPTIRRRDRETVVFAPNPGTVRRDREVVNFSVRQRESVDFAPNPNEVRRDRATVNFTPNVIQRDRQTSTFNQVQIDRATANFGNTVQRDRNISTFHAQQ